MRTVFVDSGMRVIGELATVDSNIRTDAGETAFFERQLEVVESRLYEKKLRELKYRTLIPVSSRDGAGAAVITYYMYTPAGMAKIIANPTDDLPRADVFAKEHTAKVHQMGEGVGYSTRELRRSQMSGVPLDTMKIDALRRAFREGESRIAWNGDADHGIVGVFDNPNIPEDQAALNGGGTSRLWKDKTPDEILDDISSITGRISSVTNDVHEANTFCLPIDHYNLIARKARSANSDTTILGFVMDPKNGFGIDRVEKLPECKGVGTGGTDVALAYERDPEVLELRIPMEMSLLPPERRNLEILINAESEIGGVVIRYPLAMRKLYGI